MILKAYTNYYTIFSSFHSSYRDMWCGVAYQMTGRQYQTKKEFNISTQDRKPLAISSTEQHIIV